MTRGNGDAGTAEDGVIDPTDPTDPTDHSGRFSRPLFYTPIMPSPLGVIKRRQAAHTPQNLRTFGAFRGKQPSRADK